MFIALVSDNSQAPAERNVADVAPLELGVLARRRAINIPLLTELTFQTASNGGLMENYISYHHVIALNPEYCT